MFGGVRQLLHKCAIVVTGFSICSLGRVVALFDAEFLEVSKGGFFGWSEMADVTSQPGLSFGSIWWWRADGASALVSDEWIHVLMLSVSGNERTK